MSSPSAEATTNQAEQISALESQLTAEKSMSSEWRGKHDRLQGESQATKQHLESSLTCLQEQCSDLTTKLETKERLLEELSDKNNVLEAQTQSLDQAVASGQARLESAQAQFAKDKSALQEAVEDLTEAKKLLLSGKVELQHQLEAVKRYIKSHG